MNIYKPIVKDQNNTAACCACAIASALECLDKKEYSEAWIYYHLLNEQEGIIANFSIFNCLQMIKYDGAVLKEDLNIALSDNQEDIVKTIKQDIDNIKSKTIKFKFKRFEDKDEIKEKLNAGYPIIFGIKQEKEIILNNKYIAQLPNKVFDYHAILCYGYNDDGYIVQNSWGEDWGNSGTCILPYDYPITEMWTVWKPEEN